MPARILVIEDNTANLDVMIYLHGSVGSAPNRPVFYPGKKFGLNEPFDCLRLKALRREQDVEYMTLLARRKVWDRKAVGHAVAAALDLSEETRRRYEVDAGPRATSRRPGLAFQQVWEYNSDPWAGGFLDEPCRQTIRSRVEPMKKIAHFIHQHRSPQLLPGSIPAVWWKV